MSLKISQAVSIPLSQIEFTAIRAQGAGGQHVNKVSTAVHLRFDVKASTLPEFYKERLLALSDQRVNDDGVIVIKAQGSRSREANREDACNRLVALIKQATAVQKKRRPTKPGRAAKQRRMDGKARRGKTKTLRGKVDF